MSLLVTQAFLPVVLFLIRFIILGVEFAVCLRHINLGEDLGFAMNVANERH